MALTRESDRFDIIGDVHGCADELELLLDELGYAVRWAGVGSGRQVSVTPPEGRKIVFVGDLASRGPRAADSLSIAMHMVGAGTAIGLQGNHDWKLARWLDGDVPVDSDLEDAAGQLATESEEFRREAGRFLNGLGSYVVLDEGWLVVAHAGLTEEMIGKESDAIRRFTLFGNEDGGPKDAWVEDYHGAAAIVYGHVPKHQVEWRNNTLGIDTGCVYGGRLTALRWPERQLMSVSALRAYAKHKTFKPSR